MCIQYGHFFGCFHILQYFLSNLSFPLFVCLVFFFTHFWGFPKLQLTSWCVCNVYSNTFDLSINIKLEDLAAQELGQADTNV